MNRYSQKVMRAWADMGPRFLPFADAASKDLPLSSLLRLSLFQVSVGMALVLLVGTLNRVMIVELGVPASLVATMISLPVLFAPFRALVGFRSDNHRSALGWRRVPYIWQGTMIQFGGLAIMPFALLVLSGGGNANQWPAWIGHAGAGLAFLLVGAGLHTTQTAGLALATDLAPTASQPKVVGLMYVMQLLGMIVSALVFGAALADFSPGRLVQVIQACRRDHHCAQHPGPVETGDTQPCAHRAEPAATDVPRVLGQFQRWRQRCPSPGGRRSGHHGVQHAGCAAGALRRSGI